MRIHVHRLYKTKTENGKHIYFIWTTYTTNTNDKLKNININRCRIHTHFLFSINNNSKTNMNKMSLIFYIKPILLRFATCLLNTVYNCNCNKQRLTFWKKHTAFPFALEMLITNSSCPKSEKNIYWIVHFTKYLRLGKYIKTIVSFKSNYNSFRRMNLK